MKFTGSVSSLLTVGRASHSERVEQIHYPFEIATGRNDQELLCSLESLTVIRCYDLQEATHGTKELEVSIDSLGLAKYTNRYGTDLSGNQPGKPSLFDIQLSGSEGPATNNSPSRSQSAGVRMSKRGKMEKRSRFVSRDGVVAPPTKQQSRPPHLHRCSDGESGLLRASKWCATIIG